MEDKIPTTFHALYMLGCKMLNDESPYENNYKDLDALKQYIESYEKSQDTQEQSKTKNFKYALSSKRVCVVIPYELFEDKRLPPDDQDNDGLLLIYACPGYDTYRSDLIDHMKHDLENNPYETEQNLIKWKLLRLGKMYDLGWNEYCRQYLEPLKDRNNFIEGWIKAASN